MSPELMEDYKKELLENIQAEMKDEGKVSSFMQIIGEKEDLDKPVIIHIVTHFDEPDSKDFFVQEIIPEISKKLKSNVITPKYVVFVSEVWITRLDTKTNESKKDEAVLIAFSSEEGDKLETYDIIRHAYEVDKNGQLTSKTDLVLNDEFSIDSSDEKAAEGRFSHLYQTLMKEFNK